MIVCGWDIKLQPDRVCGSPVTTSTHKTFTLRALSLGCMCATPADGHSGSVAVAFCRMGARAAPHPFQKGTFCTLCLLDWTCAFEAWTSKSGTLRVTRVMTGHYSRSPNKSLRASLGVKIRIGPSRFGQSPPLASETRLTRQRNLQRIDRWCPGRGDGSLNGIWKGVRTAQDSTSAFAGSPSSSQTA